MAMGGKFINPHSCKTALPLVLAHRGALAPKEGTIWACNCGQQWLLVNQGTEKRPKLAYIEHDSPLLTRDQVVDAMMATLPAEGTMKPDYPGDATIRSAFMVALYALERLRLDGGKWLKS